MDLGEVVVVVCDIFEDVPEVRRFFDGVECQIRVTFCVQGRAVRH